MLVAINYAHMSEKTRWFIVVIIVDVEFVREEKSHTKTKSDKWWELLWFSYDNKERRWAFLQTFVSAFFIEFIFMNASFV